MYSGNIHLNSKQKPYMYRGNIHLNMKKIEPYVGDLWIIQIKSCQIKQEYKKCTTLSGKDIGTRKIGFVFIAHRISSIFRTYTILPGHHLNTILFNCIMMFHHYILVYGVLSLLVFTYALFIKILRVPENMRIADFFFSFICH